MQGSVILCSVTHHLSISAAVDLRAGCDVACQRALTELALCQWEFCLFFLFSSPLFSFSPISFFNSLYSVRSLKVLNICYWESYWHQFLQLSGHTTSFQCEDLGNIWLRHWSMRFQHLFTHSKRQPEVCLIPNVLSLCYQSSKGTTINPMEKQCHIFCLVII